MSTVRIRVHASPVGFYHARAYIVTLTIRRSVQTGTESLVLILSRMYDVRLVFKYRG
jgi:hypothetical protein